jgi:hypothetical protein
VIALAGEEDDEGGVGFPARRMTTPAGARTGAVVRGGLLALHLREEAERAEAANAARSVV